MEDAINRCRALFQGRFIVPYQPRGIQWMLGQELDTSRRGGMLCDEMGLGKTAQTIAVMLGNPVKNTLILAPKSVVGQWKSEIEKFAPKCKITCFDGPGRHELISELEESRVVLAPYSVLVNRKNFDDYTPLHKVQWGRVVLDEGHEIRNKTSKIHKSAIKLNSTYRWILSGTPIFNSMKDFIALSAFLGVEGKYVQAYPGRIREKYILRRTKEDVASHNKRLALPPLDMEVVEVQMSPDETIIYNEVFEAARETIIGIMKTSTNIAKEMLFILECILRCRQCMIHPQLYYDGVNMKSLNDELTVYEGRSNKMDKLVEMIQTHPNEKSLVFCQFITEMDIIHEMLMELGIKVFRIDGSVTKDMRDERINGFRNCPDGAVFIIQVKAGGVGLNLQEATRVYITAPSWNPATELQAIGRAHRTGQSRKVIVKRLIYSHTDEWPSIEESIMGLQHSKSKICAEVLNDGRLLNHFQRGVDAKSLCQIFNVKK